MKVKVLLTGANGQIGRCIQELAPTSWLLLPTDIDELDITDQASVMEMIKEFIPKVIINLAAYTHIDSAEDHPQIAFLANATGPQILAKGASMCGARLFQLSTDYVFDGTKRSSYSETEPPSPINVYGKSKLAGELLALAGASNSVVVRTSAVYSSYGRNFLKTMLRVGRNSGVVPVVGDHMTRPTHAKAIARFLIDVITRDALRHGIYHFAGERKMTWYQFARAIFQHAAMLDPSYRDVKMVKVTAADLDRRATRPAMSVLRVKKVASYSSVNQPTLELDSIIPELLGTM